MSGFDVVATWPDLFVDLDDDQQDTVRQVFASEHISGWEPDRDAVADLVAFTLGHIDFNAYLSRSADRAAAVRAAS
ncbi:hypothetical protein [Microbacterium maritypicum]|uniref:Uncharacterized protein n=1 Tax=Microbacterium maritypicum TaxID=33918 RepID=A0A4Y4B822_MICMQ|nr:hypothetical protein [Microbacterium liquefaciens]GEC76721.1 hypothetical protein MLI01_28660 [Microbacterium liquefaciens]GGV61835.1 hypothetical protein GCM10010213_25820 [Microbacterium liquefaciens]